MTTSKSWMRASTLLLFGWAMCSCSQDPASDALRAEMHMVIGHRPQGVDVSEVSMFRPTGERSPEDDAATLLRSMECTDSCYVGVVARDDASSLAVLEALCQQIDDHRAHRGTRMRLDVFVSSANFPKAEEIIKACSLQAPGSQIEFGATIRTDL